MKGKLFKRATALLSTAAMLLTCADFSAIDFSVHAGNAPELVPYDVNGDKTIDDGETAYALDSADDLYWFADKVNGEDTGANAFLTKDITINSGVLDENGELNSDTSNFKAWINCDSQWYQGTFDGAGYTISGLYSNDSSAAYVGLFGLNIGTIKNVSVTDSYFCGNGYVGGVCGYCKGTIENCSNTGKVEGYYYAGGICGFNVTNSTIQNCYNTGAVEGYEYAGGISGNNGETVKNCYNTGAVSGTENVGGICGYSKEGKTIQSCYYLNTTAEKGIGDGTGSAEAKSAEQFASGEVAYKLGEAFYQTLGEDDLPVLDSNHKTVYRTSPCVSYSNTKDKAHSLESYAKVEATCTTDGHEEYWYCSNCEKYFSDEACQNEMKDITAWKSQLPATGHKLTKTDRIEPTCTTDGCEAYWYCETCKKYFSDEACADSDIITDLDAWKSDETKGFIPHLTHNFENGICTLCGVYEPAKAVADVTDIDGDGETSDDVYEISNAGQLYWFAGLVNGTLEGVAKNHSANAYLANDITVNENLLTDLINVNKDDGTATVNEDKTVSVWTPIGTDDYSGTFDGAGHTVSGLYFNNSDANRVGLFGYVRLGSNSKIMNLTVADSYFCGKEKVGGICGIDYYVTIQNCANTGIVKGENYAGGVCGYIYNRVIENCYNTGRVWGDSDIGGICGYSCEKNIIRNCFNTGEVNGNERVGGICGKANYIGSKVPIMIINCYNTGAVTGTEYFGSICGVGYKGAVVNCYYLKSDGISGKGNGSDSPGSIEVKSAEQFASGEVCWLLNGGETQAETPVFFQNIGEDAFLVLDSTHSRVYMTTNCVTYSNTAGNKDHSLASEKKDATCTEDGHSEYWYCKDCGQYFSDAECTAVIDNIETWKSENAISAAGHSYKDGICENCGAFEDGIGARLAGASLSLDGSIGVNFYMQLAETVAADENAYLLVTYPNSSDDKMAVSDAQQVNMDGKKYYVFKCNVAATEMTDTITAQIMTSSGDGTKYSYSVKEYADYLLAHTAENAEYAKAEKLVRAMLNYGAYAQTFKGHNAENLPCEPSDVSNYVISEHGFSAAPGNAIKFAGANLSMLSNTTLRLFFEADDINGVTIMNGAEELEIGVNNGLYFVEIENISPDKLSNDFTVFISDDGMVIYSPMTYCCQVSQTSNDAALVNLVKAIAQYNDAAEAYFKEAKV